MKSIFGFWECDHCESRFAKEKAYTKHRCELMERAEFLETQRGKFAFSVYNTYMQKSKKLKQTTETFISSRYYNAILKFVTFYYSTMLPDMPDYIDFVVNELDLLPTFWCRNDVYEAYITDFDARVTPMQQAEITFKHIAGLASQVGIEPEEVFEHMEANEITKYIQCKRWSPWVLLASDVFAKHLRQCNEYEQTVLGAMINEDIWLDRFRKMPNSRKTILNLTKEFGI